MPQNTAQKIIGLLTPAERRQSLAVLAMVTAMALLELLGIASVMPFLAVMGNPELIQSNEWLALIHETSGFSDERQFLVALGAATFIFISLAALFRTLRSSPSTDSPSGSDTVLANICCRAIRTNPTPSF